MKTMRTINTKLNTSKMINSFMTGWFCSLPEDLQREAWEELNAIVDNAKLEVVEDAEKAIGKLRTFSL